MNFDRRKQFLLKSGSLSFEISCKECYDIEPSGYVISATRHHLPQLDCRRSTIPCKLQATAIPRPRLAEYFAQIQETINTVLALGQLSNFQRARHARTITSIAKPPLPPMPRGKSPPFRRRLPWPRYLYIVALLFAMWLPLVRAQEKTAADYFVHSLPGAPEPLLKMYAGHVEITPEHHGNMFFWLAKNKHLADRPRTVLWLNGGPGCSSMDGALMEIGPYRVNEDGTLRYNDGSWDEFANILFVDNPVGTGFSYVDGDSYVRDLNEMAAQMVTFLEKWFALFPEHMHDDVSNILNLSILGL